MSKMSPEELDSWLRMVEVQLSRPHTAAVFRAHLAALEAERDEWRRKAMDAESHPAVVAMKAERDAALADNAALLATLRDAVMAMNHACDTLNDMDAVDPEEDASAMAAVERVTKAMEHIDAGAYPGTALLEEHRKALVHAKNEGREEASRYVRSAGNSLLAAEILDLRQPIPCCERDTDSDGNCDRHPARP